MKQAGISVLVSAPAFKTSDYRAMVAEVRGECADLRDVIYLGEQAWESLLATGRAATAAVLAERDESAVGSTTRSTSSTPPARPASPRAPPSPTTTC